MSRVSSAVSSGLDRATDSVQSVINEKKKEIKDYVDGEMGHPLIIIAVSLLITLIFIAVVFYLEYVFFNKASDTGGAGIIGKALPDNFFSNLHGFWFYLVGLLMIAGAAAALGLSYIKNESALMVTIVSSAILSLLFFLALKNLTDQANKASFWIWVIISTLAPFLLGLWGWLSARRYANTLALPEGAKLVETDQANKEMAEKASNRAMWALVSFVTGAIGSAVTFAGFYVLSPALTQV